MISFVVFTLLLHGFIVDSTTDFYDLLGITRDASKSEIRRAFKKVALEKHPDKNTDDPKAHEVFTKINKAYETLKDDELRKKYDTYGEEGLKDDHFSNQYQSWNFYNEQFGIYDEDREIITLSYSDFEQAVSGTTDIWFINFYSPHCSHCHTLAPTWREVARELNGVVRVGAVNCQDDWSLCNMQGIRGYPSLRMYPSMEEYHGAHGREEMVSYLLDRLDSSEIDLDMEYVERYFGKKNLLISFCDGDGMNNCASERTMKKLSVMLDNLAVVANVNCYHKKEVCSHFGKTEDVVFFSLGCSEPTCGKDVSSLDAIEIMEQVLKMLPQPKTIDYQQFKEIDNDIYQNKSIPQLLIFVKNNNDDDVEIVKLTALINKQEMNIAKVDCAVNRDLCQHFLVTKHPTVILLKNRGHEYHHGRYNAHDVALFAKESLESNVIVLEPKHFPAVAQDTENNWFIDFFTPWCPPCLKLLPEWRKAGKQIGDQIAYFGTVDCTMHRSLCQSYNIRSYPTTIFYNKSVPHSFSGYHTADEIVSFAEDILHPPVVKLTPETFETLVNGKKEGETWLVDFYAPWCGPCQELAPTYRELAKMLGEDAKLGDVDCQAHADFCSNQHVNSYPQIRLYPHNSQGASSYVKHQGWRDLHSLHAWVFRNFPSIVEDLSDHDFFNVVLNSKEAYLVDFFANWCGHCHEFAPHYEQLAKRVEGKIKLAKIDCAQYKSTCRQAGVRQYPTVKLYVGAISDEFSQSVFGDTIDSLDAEHIELIALQSLEEHKERVGTVDKIVHDEM